MLTFTVEEQTLIVVRSVLGGWDDESDPTKALKRKIKDYYLTKSDLCCYCLRTMHGWHRMTIDVEHVLPKSAYPQFTFEPKNLNLSCKRCNMRVKGEKVSFFAGTADTANQFRASEYSFVHPNLDRFEDHIKIVAFQYNAILLVKYNIVEGSTKGAEAYNFFRLSELERDSYDEAQGGGQVEPSEKMPAPIAQALTAILAAIE